jgi:hypothetical protein
LCIDENIVELIAISSDCVSMDVNSGLNSGFDDGFHGQFNGGFDGLLGY